MNKLELAYISGATVNDVRSIFDYASDVSEEVPGVTLLCVDFFIASEADADTPQGPLYTIVVASNTMRNIEELAQPYNLTVSPIADKDYERFAPIATARIARYSVDETFMKELGEMLLNRYPECRKNSVDEYSAICSAAALARIDAAERDREGD